MCIFFFAVCILSCYYISRDLNLQGMSYSESQRTVLDICVSLLVFQLGYAVTERCQILDLEHGTSFMQLLVLRNSSNTFSCASSEVMIVHFVFTTTCSTLVIFCFSLISCWSLFLYSKHKHAYLFYEFRCYFPRTL